MKMAENELRTLADNEYERCWNTGEYEDQDCGSCPYADECSGAENEKDD